MRILQMTTELRAAGAERVVSDLSRGLAERGHDVRVLSLMPLPESSPILDELSEAEIPVASLGLTRWTPWRAAGWARILRGWHPQVVHAHLFHPRVLSRMLPPRGAKIINTVHVAERRPGRGWQFFLDRLTLNGCHAQTAVSHAVASYHAQRVGVGASEIPVILNGIDPPRPLQPPEVRALRQEWGVENCDLVLGSAGRLAYQKGYDQLLRLLPELSRQIPEGQTWGLVLMGVGPDRAALERQALLPPPNVRVHFAGFRKDAARCLGALDVFIMPSRYEGFGISLIEAMAHGVPAVASDVDSLPELMRSYPNGVCVDFSEPSVAAAAILDASRKPRIPLQPFPFSVNTMITEYEALYARVTN